jgi:hypothetical protein
MGSQVSKTINIIGDSHTAPQERPAVGTTHPVAVADADQRAHPEARWVGVGGYIGMFTRLPDDQPQAVNVSRLTPTVISPSCNCDELIAARETIARLTVEIDKREAARAEADKIACKVFAMDSSLRLELATVTQERDALRTSLDLAAQAVNNLAHGPRVSK